MTYPRTQQVAELGFKSYFLTPEPTLLTVRLTQTDHMEWLLLIHFLFLEWAGDISWNVRLGGLCLEGRKVMPAFCHDLSKADSMPSLWGKIPL